MHQQHRTSIENSASNIMTSGKTARAGSSQTEMLNIASSFQSFEHHLETMWRGLYTVLADKDKEYFLLQKKVLKWKKEALNSQEECKKATTTIEEQSQEIEELKIDLDDSKTMRKSWTTSATKAENLCKEQANKIREMEVRIEKLDLALELTKQNKEEILSHKQKEVEHLRIKDTEVVQLQKSSMNMQKSTVAALAMARPSSTEVQVLIKCPLCIKRSRSLQDMKGHLLQDHRAIARPKKSINGNNPPPLQITNEPFESLPLTDSENR